MIPRRMMRLLFPMVALGLTLAAAVPAHAQDASLRVTFGHQPRWVGVQGTQVREIRTADRPDYDMFRYGGRYYAYNNNHWYSSRRGNGRYRMIEDREVPMQITRVPREHWRNYPAGWDQPHDAAPSDAYHRHH